MDMLPDVIGFSAAISACVKAEDLAEDDDFDESDDEKASSSQELANTCANIAYAEPCSDAGHASP
eukprot:3396573-Karenia_brevis.AAC.1